MVLRGQQISRGTELIPLTGGMLTSNEFYYVIARDLGPKYGNALMMYAPERRNALWYASLDEATRDLEEVKKHLSLDDVGIYKMQISTKKVL